MAFLSCCCCGIDYHTWVCNYKSFLLACFQDALSGESNQRNAKENMNVRIMYALKQMMKEISFTRKNYKLTATKRMNTPDREHPPEHPEHPVFIKP